MDDFVLKPVPFTRATEDDEDPNE